MQVSKSRNTSHGSSKKRIFEVLTGLFSVLTFLLIFYAASLFTAPQPAYANFTLQTVPSSFSSVLHPVTSFFWELLKQETQALASLSHLSSESTPQQRTQALARQSVLAATTQNVLGKISFNIPAFFNDTAEFKKPVIFDDKTTFGADIEAADHNLNLGTGKITASNVLSGIIPGQGIGVIAGQSPTVSNTGVLSVQGQTGAVTFTAGSNITLDGLKISASVPSSSNSFATITTGGTSFSAGSSTDTLTFTAGSGVTISPDTTNKKLTFSATGGLSGLTTNGVLYATDATTATSLTPGTSGFVLQSNGSGSPPSWVANSGSSPSFSTITSGTNTQAAMVVGSGATLDFTGTGTINASSLLGSTWVTPGTIGSTTANTGAFTTLSASGLISANAGLTLASGQNLTLSGFTSGSVPYINASHQLAQDNSNFFWDATNHRLGIGTTSPTVALDVADSASISGNLFFRGGGAQQIDLLNNSSLSFLNSVGGDTGLTPGSPALFISSSGALGFNTSTTVAGSPIVFGGNSAPGATDSYALGAKAKEFNGLFAKFGALNRGLAVGSTVNNATNIQAWDTTYGNGTTPVATISAQTSFAAMLVDNTIGDLFTASSSGLSRFTIQQNGNVIVRSGPATGSYPDSGNGIVTISESNANEPSLLLENGTRDLAYPNADNLQIGQWDGTTWTERMRLDTSGNLGLGTTTTTTFKLRSAGDIGPNATDTYNLGSAALEWNNLYVKNIVTTATSGQVGFWQRTASGGFNYLAPNTTADLLSIGQTTGLTAAGLSVKVDSLGNAAAYVENSGGSGDIFTASSAGVAKFVIDKNGNVGIGQMNPTALLDAEANLSTAGTILKNSGSGDILDLSNNSGLQSYFPNGGGLVTKQVTSPFNSNVYLCLGGCGSVSYENPGAMLIGSSATVGNALGMLDLRLDSAGGVVSGAGTIPIATISGKTSFAGLVVDNSGLGDIFTASSSGLNRFVITQNGQVGIGTNNFNTSTTTLQVVDNTAANQSPIVIFGDHSDSQRFQFLADLGGGAVTYMDSGTGSLRVNGDLQFQTNGSNNRMVIKSNGNIGVGTSSPLATFDIRANSNALSIASISGNTAFAGLVVDNSGLGDIFTASSSGLNRFVITQSGNVGIGLTQPAANLHIKNADTTSSTPRLAFILESANQGSGAGPYMQFRDAASSDMARILGVDINGFGGGLAFYTKTADGNGGSASVEKMRLDANGYLGIGSTVPLGTLDVETNPKGNASAIINNPNSVSDIFTASAAGATKFVINNSGNVGIGTSNPTHTLVVNANCASITGNPGTCGDYAEYYNASEVVAPGDVISLDPSIPDGKLVERTRGAYDEKVIGVAATNPAFVIEEDKLGIGGGMVTPSMKPPIALAGRVPTKVSTINGVIHTGDTITSSTLIGFGMKSTQAGPTVGKAMEDFDPANGHSGEGIIPCPDGTPASVICGKVYVFINVSYADPFVIITDSGNLSVSGQPVNNTVSSATVLPTQSSSSSVSSAQFNQLFSGVSQLQSQIASLSSQLGKMDDLSKQVADLGKIVTLTQALQGTGSPSALLNGSVSSEDMTVGGNLNVLGRSVVSDLGITGKLTAGLLTIDGMDTTAATTAASIDTLSGPLMIQPLAVNGVDFINGKVTIDTNGNIVTMGDITAKTINADKVNLKDNGDNASVGEAVIPAGKTSIEVKTSSVTDTSKIFVTVKGSSPIPISVISQNSAVSFTVERNADLNDEVKFSWWIIN